MSAGQAIDLFTQTYGHGPAVVASAPGRVNLIGEHLDYNGGQVLPIAIGLRTWVAMSRAPDGESSAVSPGERDGRFRLADERPAGAWFDYVHGTLRECAALGVGLSGVRVAVASDLPRGAGLSSSAALEVATALAAVVTAGDRVLERWDEIASVAFRAETRFVGVPSGIMDQTVSAYAAAGHALRIWCDDERREHVPFRRTVLVFDTATPRQLRSSPFSERRAECAAALDALRRADPTLSTLAEATPELLDAVPLPDALRRRARHVITETRRVEETVEALECDAPLGALLLASHESLRTDFECSSPELDWVVDEAMHASGIEGARLTGAGWGGCAVILGDEGHLKALAAPLTGRFTERWKRRPQTWLTTAEDGVDIDFAIER